MWDVDVGRGGSVASMVLDERRSADDSVPFLYTATTSHAGVCRLRFSGHHQEKLPEVETGVLTAQDGATISGAAV